jgi:hypothetical protein
LRRPLGSLVQLPEFFIQLYFWDKKAAPYSVDSASSLDYLLVKGGPKSGCHQQRKDLNSFGVKYRAGKPSRHEMIWAIDGNDKE